MLPRLSVDTRRGISFDFLVCMPQPIDVVDMVQKRSESLLLIPSCCLSYPLQRTGQAFLARCPVLVALGRVSLGSIPSLHRLRCVAVRVVRRLLRYYGSI